MKKPLFTPEELEELRRFDEEIDNAEMTEEDYQLSVLIDDILFPEKAKEREKKKRQYQEKKEATVKAIGSEAVAAKYKADYQKTKEADRERKKKWYEENKDRIRAQQKAYRIRAGMQMFPEEKERKKQEAKAKKAEKN